MSAFGIDFGAAETSYSIAGGIQQAVNPYVGYEVAVIQLYLPAAAALSVSSDVSLPADAEVDLATFAVTAAPAPLATAASVAEIRDAEPPGGSGSAVTVDFGRLVTVSALYVGSAQSLYRWDGTGFTFLVEGDGAFPEVSTERLLAEFPGAVDVDDLRESASLSLPALPTGLELLIDGTTVWFERQGGTAGVDAPESSGVGYGIDRTDAVREAFRRRPGGPVRVELRASTPGLLSLGHHIEHHRVHVVAFPEGTARTVDLAEEGPFVVGLPLPAISAPWLVDEVRMIVRGSVGAARILPAEGPPLADDALVVLGPGRSVLAAVPAGLRDRFESLSAVRLPLRSPGGGSEVAGRLLADAAGRPGETVPGGDLAPVRLEAGDMASWTTLATAAPVAVDGPLWLELSVGYGEVEWMLTESGATDPTTPGAELHRRLAGGGVRPFPTLVDLGPRLGAIRLVGEAPANQPIGALVLDLGTGAPVQLTPGGSDVRAVVGLQTPIVPEGSTITLEGVARAIGSCTFSDVQVAYRE
jgi:hypothetical protein